ncbi:hypothetical protein C8F04DRAFT_1400897 [Mycena alexandri]|uniref:Uncharacterized protein n=1 Tax=Mycena alexandri TaxID=1745969 RepID=A0AAD6WRW1_9AGAR|nr:hypothetical protein C8F04DRAFT_1400897 [Mycena alexandri]
MAASREYLDANPTTRVSRLLLSDSAQGNESAVNADVLKACPTIEMLTNRILHRTHGTLSGFSYLLYTCDADSFLEYEFPKLRESTLGIDDIWRYKDTLFHKESLTRLHVARASDHHDHTPPSMLVILNALQNLTHLRISGPRREGDVPALSVADTFHWDQIPRWDGGLVSSNDLQPRVSILIVMLALYISSAIHSCLSLCGMIPPDFTLMIQPGPDLDRSAHEHDSSGTHTSFVH